MSAISLPEPINRNIFLSKQVDQDSINALSRAIIAINEDDEKLKKIYAAYDLTFETKPIKMYIDSYGGYVYQCMGLISLMKASTVPIHTIVTGCAMSCGFLISISGHKRFGYPRSTYLYHQVSSGAVGKVKEMEEEIIEAKRLQALIEDVTLSSTKITTKKLEKIYKAKKDWFMDSEEALRLSVIDEIIK
jgi:ATP-dependent Clp protease protease subunit